MSSEPTTSLNNIMPRTLVLNPDSMELAAELLNGTSIEPITGNPMKPLHKFHHAYNHLFSYHMLNRAYNEDAANVLKAWDRCLKPGGLMHVFVPSFQWAVDVFGTDDPPPHLIQHIYGWNRDNPTRSIYWPRLLRADYQRAGLAVIHTQRQVYGINVDGKEYRADQIYVQSRKPDLQQDRKDY